MITVIIPTYNSQKYIKNCLDSLFTQTYSSFKVVVYDNGSEDQTITIVKSYPVKLYKGKNNIGWVGANNYCISRAKSKYLFLLNVDTALDKDCLKNLYEFSELAKDVVCVSPKIVNFEEFHNIKHTSGYPLAFSLQDGLIKAYKTNAKQIEVSFVPGTAMFVNRQVLKNKLYFQKDFFMYHDDVELCLRILSQTSYKLFYLKTAIVGHHNQQSFTRTSTCRLALRNLFKILVSYQSKQDFLRNFFFYMRNLWRMYRIYYYKYFPASYLVYSSFYLFKSLLFLLFNVNTQASLRRISVINNKLARYPKDFEFYF